MMNMMNRFAPGRAPIFLAVGGLALIAIACASRSARTGSTAAGLAAFDSGSAWNYLQAQLAFGPRPVGTPAHEKLKDYLAAELRQASADVQLQQWTDPAIHLPLTNLIARFPGKGSGQTQGLPLLARILKDNPPPVTIWLVFFDGEDYGPGLDRMFIGSRYFAKNQPAGTPRKGVLLDMIGAANVSVPKERNSAQRASGV